MKNRILKLFIASLLVIVSSLTVLFVSNAALYFEPDGTNYEEYLYPKNDCNRTITVNCIDTSTGKNIKTLVFHTKYGVEGLLSFSIYGYDITNYTSTAGALQSCKLTWASGTATAKDAYVQIRYKFSTLLSGNSITATISMKPSEEITLISNYYLYSKDGKSASLFYSTKNVIDYGDNVKLSARTIPGYTLDSDYLSVIEGSFTYSWVGESKNILSKSFTYDVVNTNLSESMKEMASFDETKNGKLDYAVNRKIEVNFYYHIDTFVISYDANGGVSAPEKQNKFQGENIVLSSDIPSREGYDFIGWNLLSTASQALYNPGDTYKDNKSVTLYAIWGIQTFDVEYDANGGSGAPEKQIKKYDVNLKLSTTIPTRSGYKFIGWDINSKASSATYGKGDTYTKNENVYLYAVWAKDTTTTYVVKFNANGGTGAPTNQTKVKDKTLVLSEIIPQRDGYIFSGWSNSSISRTVSYNPGDSYTSNANLNLYAVWDKIPPTFTISYDLNGGEEQIENQTKNFGEGITLSTNIPTKKNYKFVDWNTKIDGMGDYYSPGDVYTKDEDVTLFAIWRESFFDLAIIDMTSNYYETSKNSSIKISTYLYNYDKSNDYEDIPISLYCDGKEIASKKTTLYSDSDKKVSFTVSVGTIAGEHIFEARLNWIGRNKENDRDNNKKSIIVNVISDSFELTIDAIYPNDAYYVGDDVITSFYVGNDGNKDVISSDSLSCQFDAYYFNGLDRVDIISLEKDKVVIPSQNTNLVYFKWNISSELIGKTIYLKGSINKALDVDEDNLDNNESIIEIAILEKELSSTPDTRYERRAPISYNQNTLPFENISGISWNMWEYIDGEFVLKNYGITLNDSIVEIKPDNLKINKNVDGIWKIKSGYGVHISAEFELTNSFGTQFPGEDSYTDIQVANALFSEYSYSFEKEEYSTLICVDNKCYSEDIHYIPIYVNDGDYVVVLLVTDLWTPAGVYSATKVSNIVEISGNIYDDYYVGR